MASGGLGALTVDLLLETAQWITGLDKAAHESQKFAEEIGDKFEKMGERALGSLKKLAAGAIAAFAVDNIIGFVNETQKAADALSEMAEKTGLSLQTLAQLSVTASMSGTSIDAVASSLGKFNKATAEAFSKAGSDTEKWFTALGISITDANGKLKDSETLYLETAKAIAGIEEPALRSAAAQKLLGKSGAEQIPMMIALANQSAEVTEAAKKYGEEIARLAPIAGTFEEQQAVLTTNTKTLAAVVGESLIPYFSELTKVWGEIVQPGGTLQKVVIVLVNAFKGLAIAIDACVTVVASLAYVWMGVVSAVEKFLARDFKGAVTAMAEGFANANEAGKNFETRVKASLEPLGTFIAKTNAATTETTKFQEALAKLKADELAKKAAEAAKKAEREMSAALKAAIAEQQKGEKEMERMQERRSDLSWGQFADAEKRKLEALRTSLQADEAMRKESDEATQRMYREAGDRLRADEARAWGGFYDGILTAGLDAFQMLFSETKGGWDNMLEGLAKSFKKILMDYITSQFAKPFLMKLIASAPGSLGAYGSNELAKTGDKSGGFNFSQMYSQAGDWYSHNFGASSYGEGGANFMGPRPEGYTSPTFGGLENASWTSAPTGQWAGVASAGAGLVGGFLGGQAASWAGAGERGSQLAMSYAAQGAIIGMQVYGIIGAAVGAFIGALAGILSDPDPDAMRKASFGAVGPDTEGVTKWKGKSKFGSFGFSKGEWLSDENMGPAMDKFIKGIKAMDDALAQFMTDDQIAEVTKRLAEAKNIYELGMEHGDVSGLADIIKDRLTTISEVFHTGLGEFVKAFKGDAEDLIVIVTSFIQAMSSAKDFNVDEIIEELRPKGKMETFRTQESELSAFIPTVDTTAESMASLVDQMLAFQAATVNLVMAIDAAAAAMHEGFMTTAEKITMATMTPEEQYNYLQKQTEDLYRQLEAETDPAKAQKIAEKINANINKAWDLLTPEQQAQQQQAFLDRINMVDTAVADKMGALRQTVIDDAADVMGDITDRLETVFGSAAAAAAAQQKAADTQVVAANTPHTVVVIVGDGGTVQSTG